MFVKLLKLAAYCYYYVDLSRMLPVEQYVPKSVSIIGQLETTKALSFQIFLEYDLEISVDVLTGTSV